MNGIAFSRQYAKASSESSKKYQNDDGARRDSVSAGMSALFSCVLNWVGFLLETLGFCKSPGAIEVKKRCNLKLAVSGYCFI